MDMLNEDNLWSGDRAAHETAADAGGPLAGVRVLELGHFVAAPFATRVLGDLGADVIKVEPPGAGDPARTWGRTEDGKSVWWSVHARNKRVVTLDLKSPEGRALALDLISWADGVVENFRPGQLERWGLGPEDIRTVNPDCVLVRISGFGQNGPYRDKPSFGVIGEAIGGLRYLNGYPADASPLPPPRFGVSLGDSVAGLYAAIGLLAGVLAKRSGLRNRPLPTVDVALYEAVFSLLEGALPEYGRFGTIRQPSGCGLPTAAPTSAYPTADGEWILIAGNSDRIFGRLMALIGRPDLGESPRFATNAGRLAGVAELDAAIAAWSETLPAIHAISLLEDAMVPACRLYTIKDCVEDAHFRRRGMVRNVTDPRFGEVLHPGAVPVIGDPADAPLPRPGPEIGTHNQEVFSGLLGVSHARLDELRSKGVI